MPCQMDNLVSLFELQRFPIFLSLPNTHTKWNIFCIFLSFSAVSAEAKRSISVQSETLLSPITRRISRIRTGSMWRKLLGNSGMAIAKRSAGNVYRTRPPTRSLCTSVSAGVSNSNSKQAPHDNEKLNFKTDDDQYDVAIVGGGMVGMAFACSLASMPLTKHLKVAIIDPNPALLNGNNVKINEPPDPRVSTITPATISIFKDIGAWQYIQEHRHAYFDKMQVWDYTGMGFTRYNARDVNKEALGCVVENKVLQGSLLSRFQNADFQKTIFSSRLTSMSLHSSSAPSPVEKSATRNFQGRFAKLELSEGNSLFAKLVVGADGSKSRVRELAGLDTTGWNYSQNAVICTVEHSYKNSCAWQRFLPNGPIALLPMGDYYSNIVWTMNPKESSDHKSMSEGDFIKAVNHALDYGYGPHPNGTLMGNGNIFSWFIGDVKSSVHGQFEVPPKVVKLASERMVFPLSLRHAKAYASSHVVLIGDAAHTVHPLAGQGVNLGFGDAFSLSRVISEGIAVGTDIAEVSLLRKYEADRKPTNIAMMAILDGFQKAYSVDFGPLNIVRAAAFNAANYISPLKRSIISYASGEQRLPLFL